MASYSQQASQNEEMPWTTFRLARFSYAANEGLHDTHINWTHHPDRNNLVLVLDFSRVRISDSRWEDSKVLKVISGAEVLESLDLNSLVQEALIEEVKARELRLQTSELRVNTVIQSPRIAIRYTTRSNQVCRFQLRFISDQIFEMAISKLRSIGLPLNPSSPSNASLTGMLPRRPSPFCQSRPSSGWQERPSSSQTTVLGTPYPELPPNYSERNGNHGIASPPKLLPSPDLIQGFSSDRLRNVNFSMPPPDIRHGSAGTLSSTIHQNCTNSQVSFPQEAEVAPRPWTAPVSQVSDSLSQFLPPRRELPFDKPAAGSSSKSTTGNTGLKTSELGQDLSPPPKPTVAKKSGTRGAKQPPKIKGRAQKPLQAKKGKSSPQKEVADRNSKTTGEEASIQSLGATLLVVADGQSNVPAPSVSSSSKATLVEVAPPGRKRPLSELEASEDNGRRPLAATPQRSVSGIPSQMQPNQMEFDLPTVTTNQPESPNAIEDVSAEYLDRIDTFVSKHMSRPPPDANGSLAGYAAQSDEDRMAAIDDMICQNIMDDDFLKLCEDVENSWRRIGLGV